MRKTLLSSAIAISTMLPNLVNAQQEVAPPKVTSVDEFGVSIMSRQPQHTVATVSIGGDIGLAHTATMYANHLPVTEALQTAYRDGFTGNARWMLLSRRAVNLLRDNNGFSYFQYDFTGSDVPSSQQRWVMRVYGPAGQQDFIYANNNFEPVGDKGQSLRFAVVDGAGTLIWRTRDGIELYYQSGAGKTTLETSPVSGVRQLKRIQYPYGFRIDISRNAVTTNTGYRLKRRQIDTSVSSGWGINPLSITGFNLAYTYCSEDTGTVCSAQGWPTATFTWPAGAPSAFYQSAGARNTITITDQNGATSKFTYEAHDGCIAHSGEGSLREEWLSSDCVNQQPRKQDRFSPRLVSVKTATSSAADYSYGYQNVGALNQLSQGTMGAGLRTVYEYWQLGSLEGELISAKHRNKTATYPRIRHADNLFNWHDFPGGQATVPILNPGSINSIHSAKDGAFFMEQNARNFVISHQSTTKVEHRYYYDVRGNLRQTVANGTVLQELQYPSSCTNSNFNRCNKPVKRIDANGKVTDYAYDPESGLIESEMLPAVLVNGKSVRPTKRYKYEQKYAYFKRRSESVERASSPIWMLTESLECRSSASTESGCSGGEIDAIRTKYYYGPQDGAANNLHLLGVSVTAESEPGKVDTRVTCFAYDKYGNKIAETTPKGAYGFSSCKL